MNALRHFFFFFFYDTYTNSLFSFFPVPPHLKVKTKSKQNHMVYISLLLSKHWFSQQHILQYFLFQPFVSYYYYYYSATHCLPPLSFQFSSCCLSIKKKVHFLSFSYLHLYYFNFEYHIIFSVLSYCLPLLFLSSHLLLCSDLLIFFIFSYFLSFLDLPQLFFCLKVPNFTNFKFFPFLIYNSFHFRLFVKL